MALKFFRRQRNQPKADDNIPPPGPAEESREPAAPAPESVPEPAPPRQTTPPAESAPAAAPEPDPDALRPQVSQTFRVGPPQPAQKPAPPEPEPPAPQVSQTFQVGPPSPPPEAAAPEPEPESGALRPQVSQTFQVGPTSPPPEAAAPEPESGALRPQVSQTFRVGPPPSVPRPAAETDETVESPEQPSPNGRELFAQTQALSAEEIRLESDIGELFAATAPPRAEEPAEDTPEKPSPPTGETPVPDPAADGPRVAVPCRAALAGLPEKLRGPAWNSEAFPDCALPFDPTELQAQLATGSVTVPASTLAAILPSGWIVQGADGDVALNLAEVVMAVPPGLMPSATEEAEDVAAAAELPDFFAAKSAVPKAEEPPPEPVSQEVAHIQKAEEEPEPPPPEESIQLPCKAVLAALPREARGPAWQEGNAPEGTVPVPQAEILSQLGTGVVKIQLASVLPHLPAGWVGDVADIDVELSLADVVAAIPPECLASDAPLAGDVRAAEDLPDFFAASTPVPPMADEESPPPAPPVAAVRIPLTQPPPPPEVPLEPVRDFSATMTAPMSKEQIARLAAAKAKVAAGSAAEAPPEMPAEQVDTAPAEPSTEEPPSVQRFAETMTAPMSKDQSERLAKEKAPEAAAKPKAPAEFAKTMTAPLSKDQLGKLAEAKPAAAETKPEPAQDFSATMTAPMSKEQIARLAEAKRGAPAAPAAPQVPVEAVQQPPPEPELVEAPPAAAPEPPILTSVPAEPVPAVETDIAAEMPAAERAEEEAAKPLAPAARTTPAAPPWDGIESSIELAPRGVDINSASIEELVALVGIGEVRARAIVDHRNQNGPFGCIFDLAAVPGVGRATFRRMTKIGRRGQPDPHLALETALDLDREGGPLLRRIVSAMTSLVGGRGGVLTGVSGMPLATAGELGDEAARYAALGAQFFSRIRRHLEKFVGEASDCVFLPGNTPPLLLFGSDEVVLVFALRSATLSARRLNADRRALKEIAWLMSARAVVFAAE